MKKIFALILIISMTFSALVACENNPNDTKESDTDSDTIEDTDTPYKDTTIDTDEPIYNPETDFEYELSQSGEFVYINKYIGVSENVIIPSTIDGLPVSSIKGVTSDGVVQNGAFEGCAIKAVTIPESVTTIGLYSFKDCKELTDVVVHQNVDTLASGAFQNCEKLESIDLSQTKITALGSNAFYGCIGLKEIKLPDSLLTIRSRAFYDCSSLLDINLPPNLEKIEKNTFVNCTALKTITIPTKLDLYCIEHPSIYNTPSLEKIIFEEGRKEIVGYAFFDITSNVEITIPKSIEKFSPLPFFIHSSAKIIFWGNCPEIIEKTDFYGNPIIYYDATTKGWNDCDWKNKYTVEAMN